MGAILYANIFLGPSFDFKANLYNIPVAIFICYSGIYFFWFISSMKNALRLDNLASDKPGFIRPFPLYFFLIKNKWTLPEVQFSY